MAENRPNQSNPDNSRTVHSPKAPGKVERVDPATGEEQGTIDTNDVSDKR